MNNENPMNLRPSVTLLPWIGSLGAVMLISMLACGGTEDNNDTTTPTPDQGTMTPDQGTSTPDQGTSTPDQGTVTPDQGTTDPVDMSTDPVDMDTDPVDMATDPVDMTVEPPAGGWSIYAHPCVGNRTDTLFCDDDQTCYTGCGTTVPGRGMFVTKDGGKNWDTLVTEPEDFLNGSRVDDIWRSPDDGKLYVAGEHNAGMRVVAVQQDGTIEQIFKKGSTVDFSFTAGSFRRNSDGRAIAESLTGSGIVYREMDSADPLMSWQTGYGFWQDQFPNGVQILAMDVHGKDFYAAGSTISQPPMVFLPAWDDEFDFEILPLVDTQGLSAYAGEMWDIDVNDDGIVLGGVNQSAAVGMVYFFNFEDGKSPNDLANWGSFKVSKVIPDQATWVQGACRGDNGMIYAVGRESREGWGFVLRSKDNGATWEDISPYPAGKTKSSLDEAYRCHVTSSGGVIVAGSGGMFAVYED